MINKDFFQALDELEKEKRIKKEVFIEALETALAIAYKKHTGTAKAVEVKLNPDRNQIKIVAYQTVVEQVEDKDTQISLEDARYLDKKYKVGDVVAEDGSGALTDLSGLKEFLYGYRGNCMWLGTDGQPYTTDPTYSGMEFSNYFADCAAYLDKFFPGAGYHDAVTAGQYTALDTSATLDGEAAKAGFNERMQGDKRFKTPEQKAQGIADEKTRLLNLRDAFVKVWNSVQTDGAIRVNTLDFSADVNGDGSVAADGSETFSWSYSFDISGLEDITDVLVTYTTSGSGTVTGSREGLSMCVVRNGTSSEEELRYEPFTMLAYFVEEFNGGDWTTYHTGGETDA